MDRIVSVQSDAVPSPVSRRFVAEQNATGGVWARQLGDIQLPAQVLVDETGRLLRRVQEGLPPVQWQLEEADSFYYLWLCWQGTHGQRMLEFTVTSGRLGLHVWLFPHHVKPAESGNREWLTFWRAERYGGSVNKVGRGDLLVYRGHRSDPHPDCYPKLWIDSPAFEGVQREVPSASLPDFGQDVITATQASLREIGLLA